MYAEKQIGNCASLHPSDETPGCNMYMVVTDCMNRDTGFHTLSFKHIAKQMVNKPMDVWKKTCEPFVRAILQTIHDLHSLGFVHGDMALRNLFFRLDKDENSSNERKQRLEVALIDYGRAYALQHVPPFTKLMLRILDYLICWMEIPIWRNQSLTPAMHCALFQLFVDTFHSHPFRESLEADIHTFAQTDALVADQQAFLLQCVSTIGTSLPTCPTQLQEEVNELRYNNRVQESLSPVSKSTHTNTFAHCTRLYNEIMSTELFQPSIERSDLFVRHRDLWKHTFTTSIDRERNSSNVKTKRKRRLLFSNTNKRRIKRVQIM